ncbi:MAG: TIGR03000 domain-containing protein [Gemmataceae bacterium]
MRHTLLAAALLIAASVCAFMAPSAARAQSWSAGVYVSPGYPWGFYPYSYQGYWSNGYSLYGPPVPTYGPIPGVFGGSDARLNYRNGPDTVPARGFPKANYGFVTPTYARFEVTVPADALVSLEGMPVNQTGPQRTFRATGLEPGQSYWLRLKATWLDGGKEVVQEKTINVRGGQTVRMDLSKAEVLPPPAR